MSDPDTSYLTDEIGPLPFCQGCGHTKLVKAIDDALVKLKVDRTSRANIYGSVKGQVSNDARPMLIDHQGNTYTAVGYVHQSPDGVEIRLDPANGINVGALPHVPTSGNHRLRLVFQVTEGVTVVGFKVGDVPVASCNITVEARR